MNRYKKEWFSNLKGDVLAGIVVFMALIPEVMGFMIVAGVDPMVGVYASFCMTLITAIFGGRPGLISAAAGAMALVLASLVRDYGIEYMFATTILTGCLQIIFGYFKIGNLLKYIPKPVMIGFVNSLGIMMFVSQLEHFKGSFILLILAAIAILIIYLFPKINNKIPSPIIAIVVVTLIVRLGGIDIKTLGDMGSISSQLPHFSLPNLSLTLETLSIILPYAVSLSIVGIVESLLTAQLIDEMTDTSSNKNRETMAQGLANLVSGFFGGIAGCGMIGQSMVNLNYGGRGRFSSLVAGSFMLISMLLFSDFMAQIPVVALASVMLIVSITTINWQSLKRIRIVPFKDTCVMIVTVIIVVLTHNLAYGVVTGTILSLLLAGLNKSSLSIEKVMTDCTTYVVRGRLYFVTASDFMQLFDYQENTNVVFIDFTHVRVTDETAVDAIDKVISKYDKQGIKVELIGLSSSCELLVKKLSISPQNQMLGH